MKLFSCAVLSLLCLCTASTFCFTVINSFKEVEHIFNAATSDDLVIFDVDEVLIIGKDRIVHGYPLQEIVSFKDEYWKEFDVSVHERRECDSIKLQSYAIELVEDWIAPAIARLQEKNVPVITLTHMRTGRYYAIENMEKWRDQQLQSLGIDLSKTPFADCVLTNLAVNDMPLPTFYRGILSTGRGSSKGAVLAEFLKVTGFKPKEVIFFDDREEHAGTVEAAMNALNILCKVFHYRATITRQEEPDYGLARKQLDHLRTHKVWLSEEAIMAQ